jgi:hypothetical protein
MRPLSRLITGLTSLALVSCVAVTNLDRFQTTSATNPNYNDIELTLKGMDSHVHEYFEARIVDTTGVVQTRLVAQPFGGVNEAFTIPAAVQIGTTGLKLEFYADHNGDGKFDLTPPPGDHSWIRNIDDFKAGTDGVIRIDFDHTTTFESLDPDMSFGANLVVHVINAGSESGKRFQLRVADKSSKHVVGLYRVPQLMVPAFDAKVIGVIDSAQGTQYQVEMTFDDGMGGGVTGYRIFGASGPGTGLDLTFDPNTDAKATDVLPPAEKDPPPM